jgi:N-acetylneuraminic acid mutarotase
MIPRRPHFPTLLALFVISASLARAECFPTETATGSEHWNWAPADSLRYARFDHTASLLPDGNVLVVGGNNSDSDNHAVYESTERYVPETRSWISGGTLNQGRGGHTATLLSSGRVLVAGGYGKRLHSPRGAELYDPETDTWSGTGELKNNRDHHSATLLQNGLVLVAGGNSQYFSVLTSAELYDPVTETWRFTGSLNIGRQGHTATLLSKGKVLVVGGSLSPPLEGVDAATATETVELYSPAGGKWRLTSSLGTPRDGHTATALQDGRVLVAGGGDGTGNFPTSTEIYDPVEDSWRETGSLNFGRAGHTATLLPDGTVLVAGGGEQTVELFDPRSETWTVVGDLTVQRTYHAATLLQSGMVLLTGGSDDRNMILKTVVLGFRSR